MKYINKQTGNVIVPKHPEAEKLLAGSDRYVAVAEIKAEKKPVSKAPKKGRK